MSGQEEFAGTLEPAVRIGARRSGADLRVVDVAALAAFAERAAKAFHVLTGAPMADTRDLVRVVLTTQKHPSHFESPNEHAWFEFFWSNVKYPVAARADRRYALQLLPGGGVPRKRRRRLPQLALVGGSVP